MIQQPKQSSRYINQLPKDNPYYNILSPIFLQLQSIFNIQSQPQQKVPQADYNLKIYITQSEDQKLNNFLYTYSMPVTIQKFIEMNEDLNLQKKLDMNIATYQVKQKISQNCSVMYLAYKKVLLISGRDFVYVRYKFRSQNGKQYWVVSTSIPDQQQYPGLIRGNIIKSALRVVEKQGGLLQIWVYSVVDMKMQLKPQSTKSKGVIQIKKYVRKCYQYFFGKKQSSKFIDKQQEN